jgi:hypothetical protein
MIYVCPVRGCGKVYEMGEDHQAEPCAQCYREGWRTDEFGNTHQVKPQRTESTEEKTQ